MNVRHGICPESVPSALRVSSDWCANELPPSRFSKTTPAVPDADLPLPLSQNTRWRTTPREYSGTSDQPSASTSRSLCLCPLTRSVLLQLEFTAGVASHRTPSVPSSV